VTARRWRDKKRAFSSQALAKDAPTADTFANVQPPEKAVEKVETSDQRCL
jgi:hypothetical protein